MESLPAAFSDTIVSEYEISRSLYPCQVTDDLRRPFPIISMFCVLVFTLCSSRPLYRRPDCLPIIMI